MSRAGGDVQVADVNRVEGTAEQADAFPFIHDDDISTVSPGSAAMTACVTRF